MSRLAMVILASALTGCTYVDERQSASSAPVPTRKTVRYMPPADQYVKSKLIDFDSPYDTTFLTARDVKLTEDPQSPKNRVLSSATAQVKLGALVRGREFPGTWDLLGVRVRADRKTPATLVLQSTGGTVFQTQPISADAEWDVSWIELRALPTSMPSNEDLLLVVKSISGTALMIDDIFIAQSHTILSQSQIPQTNEPWLVRRSGLKWQVLVRENEVLSLPAAPFVPEGYRVIEANPVRVVFVSGNDTIALDRTGRLIQNQKTRLDASVMGFAKTVAENDSPATIEITDDDGRVERNLPGDLDNDGYDETRGCYSVRATASRLNVRLSPQKHPVKWPVIEVIGLPAGVVSVWLEGQLVPWVTRLSDGKAIIELPIQLERAINLQVRVK